MIPQYTIHIVMIDLVHAVSSLKSLSEFISIIVFIMTYSFSYMTFGVSRFFCQVNIFF